MATNFPPEKVVKSISRWMATEVQSGKDFVPIAQVKQWHEFMLAAAQKLASENCEKCRIDVIGHDRIDAATAEMIRQEAINLINSGCKFVFEFLPDEIAKTYANHVEIYISSINALSLGVARAAPKNQEIKN